MGKKNSKKQTGGNLKLIFSILLSILIIFLLMNYIYSTFCGGVIQHMKHYIFDNDESRFCKALKVFLVK